MASQSGTPRDNRLLFTLSPSTLDDLTPHIEPVLLRMRDELSCPPGVVDWVYFPVSGLISIVTVMEDNSSVEAAVVGREGMCGVSLLGSPQGLQLVVQSPGEGFRIEASRFRQSLFVHNDLLAMVAVYQELLFRVAAQSSACNATHHALPRLARWLLVAQDRIGSPEFAMTQEFLAQMLGVRRPTVTLAAADLQARGLVSYRRGHVTITDRPGLEAESCECYFTLRKLYHRVFD